MADDISIELTQEVVYDLSHPILDQPPCTFATVDKVPEVMVHRGDSSGEDFLTSVVSNLYQNNGTHIDLPGHLPGAGGDELMVGEYPPERFVGKVLVLDVSQFLSPIADFFDQAGHLRIDQNDSLQLERFISQLDQMEISREFLEEKLEAVTDLKGIALSTGLVNYWRHEVHPSTSYIYFFNPFLSEDACEYLAEISPKLSIVAIDSFQLEHPIINFNGNEQVLAGAQGLREKVHRILDDRKIFRNHYILLGNDILIYENVNLPPWMAGKMLRWMGQPLNFQLPNLSDNALVRPVAEVIEPSQGVLR